MSGEFSSADGQLRLVHVSAGRGGKSYLAWQKILERLEVFCRHLNQEQKRLAHHIQNLQQQIAEYKSSMER